MCSADIFLGVLAILFPPLPVWVKCGICSADSLINILLCVLGFIPGLLHAWYIIAKYPEPPYEYETVPGQDQERGRVTYVYVQSPPQQQPQPSAASGSNGGSNGGPMNYGTQSHGPSNAGEGSAGGQHKAPPSYAEVTAGDHKIQSRD
jgi:uncharacterized membrane protein YqaE (UPF0057 family)